MKHAKYHIVKATAMMVVALALDGCRATSHSQINLHTDSLYRALEHRIEALNVESKIKECDDSVVVLQFDTLGRIVTQTTAIHKMREKAEKRAEQAETVQSTTTQTTTQQKAKESAKSASASLSWWQKAKAWFAGALCACACLSIYYYVIKRIHNDQTRNL